jgi:xanthine dehydrogenase accessory factor
MLDILADLIHWHEAGKSIALATVIQTWGSSPRRAGAKMAVTLDGQMTGSVSGGCVENAVIEAGIETLKTNRPQLLKFSVADETAWDVGLSCGGKIELFVKPLDTKIFDEMRNAIQNRRPMAVAAVVYGMNTILGREIILRENGQFTGSIGNEWDAKVLNLTSNALQQGTSHRIMLNDDVEIFLDVILPPPTLVVVGGVHIAVTLVSLAKTLGYETILIDPRKAWGSKERFPHADQLIQSWIDEAFEQIQVTRSTAIAMLTHDPKLDDPALNIALNSPAFYVGALGSTTTNAKRRERLLSDGLTESQVSRLHAPIGLDIGAQTPEEIALAVMSEIVKAHRKQNQLEVNNEAQAVSSP